MIMPLRDDILALASEHFGASVTVSGALDILEGNAACFEVS